MPPPPDSTPPPAPRPEPPRFDVFLSHSSADKPGVRAVCEWLKRHGVNPWLDEASLEPGDQLTKKLGEAMDASSAAVVFIGPNGEGPWQGEEIDSLLNRAIKLSRQKDEFRIIPVLLPGADTTKLRWFLRTRLWVDLSQGVTDNEAELFRLRQAILGKAEDSTAAGEPGFNPYMGLAAFQFGDAAFFFGRVQACRDLAAKLKEWRFACIVGASGNGKSSLARAGLATDAAEEVFPGIRSLKRVTVVPGGNLRRAFIEQLAAGLPDTERADRVAKAMERIDPKPDKSSDPKAGKPSAEQWADRLNDEFRAWFPDAQQRVLFLVDQFEEVFTHRGLLTTTEADREERIRKILDCLALLATRGDKRWHFVFTLRSDFYQRCRVSAAFWKLVSADRLNFPLDELDEEGWREAIKGPAARAGAYLEAGLVETMLKDVYRQRGSMPLLQLALRELWRLHQGACLTHAAYTSLGGVANALQHRAESALKHLRNEKAEYIEIARNLFLRLTALGEGVSDSRRRLDRAELDWEGTEPQDIEHILAQLSHPDNRLLMADAQSVEVTHEVLIRECDTIRSWIEAARKEIPTLRRLTHAARRWADNQRDPVYLNAADPPRELKLWAKQTTLRLTCVERDYWHASRNERVQDHRSRRRQQQALRKAEQERLRQAEEVAKQAEARRQAEEARANEAIKREKEQSIAKKRLTVFAVACAAFALAAYWFASRAASAKVEAQQILIRGFLRTIGSSEKNLTSEEHEALWELAELQTVNQPVRTELLLKWGRTRQGVRRALAFGGRGLRAAAGLSPDTTWTSSFVNELTSSINRGAASDLISLFARGTVISRLTVNMDATNIAGIVTNLLDELKHPEVPSRSGDVATTVSSLARRLDSQVAAGLVGEIVSSLEQGTNCIAPAHFRSVLGALAELVDVGTSTKLASKVVKTLEHSKETDPTRLRNLSEAVSVLAARSNSQQVSGLVSNVVSALTNSSETNSFRLQTSWRLLHTLAKRMDSNSMTGLMTNLLKAAENLSKSDSPTSHVFWTSLSEVVVRWNESPVTRLKLLLTAKEDWNNERPTGVRLVRTGANRRLSPEQEALFFEALKNSDLSNSNFRKWIGFSDTIIREYAGKFSVPIAVQMATNAIVAIDGMGGPNLAFPTFIQALEALVPRMDSQSVARLAEDVFRRLCMKARSGQADKRLGQVLAVLAKGIEPHSSAAMATNVINAMKEVSEPYLLQNIGLPLVEMAVKVPGASNGVRLGLSWWLLVPVNSEADFDNVSLLRHFSTTLVNRLERFEAACKTMSSDDLLDLLKWPFCVDQPELIVLAELESRLGTRFYGSIGNLIQRAPSLRISRAALQSPAKRPAPEIALKELNGYLAKHPN